MEVLHILLFVGELLTILLLVVFMAVVVSLGRKIMGKSKV
jgi:hypothetical protein